MDLDPDINRNIVLIGLFDGLSLKIAERFSKENIKAISKPFGLGGKEI